ncbi:cupin domain-containing protein [Chthonobacter rhizosphaerae]|uniref:cupin domain-containing protein n=1 Tax=Chthonobacter rhizosphaerae TaxID=2735553 RepID=UPI0015EF55D6|nr:cupin domain-containing protein [Chthonobacter rhizosphaerae]
MIHAVQITRREEAPAVWVVRDQVRFMGRLEGTDLTVLEVEVPPGAGTPPHRHSSPEIFRILSGEVTFGLFEDGPPRQVQAGPGTVVTVPSGVAHNYTNSGDSQASMVVVLETSMEAFFRDLGRSETPPAGPPSEDEIAAVIAACDRHAVEMVT